MPTASNSGWKVHSPYDKNVEVEERFNVCLHPVHIIRKTFEEGINKI